MLSFEMGHCQKRRTIVQRLYNGTAGLIGATQACLILNKPWTVLVLTTAMQCIVLESLRAYSAHNLRKCPQTLDLEHLNTMTEPLKPFSSAQLNTLTQTLHFPWLCSVRCRHDICIGPATFPSYAPEQALNVRRDQVQL
jgi:hypothetical protein